ncbi:MAG: hypothetical protein QOH99_968 [Frankiaceae bacterium]|nr:hypothetical protein [Frankiaceae bacterium]
MSASHFQTHPDHISRSTVTVLERTTLDEGPSITATMAAFESIVGLRGRKIYARVYPEINSYVVCTPIKDADNAGSLGLDVGTLAGGDYLRATLIGEPLELYRRIAPAMSELLQLRPRDETRPLVEFYRRCGEVELWVPISPK